MNETIRAAKEVLAKAETELRSLIGTAAAAGDYECLTLLTGWARTLSTLDAGRLKAETRTPKTKVSRRGRSKRGNKVKSGVYPRFLRSSDSLVKIGWSKRRGEEYEHRATKHVVSAICSALAAAGQGGRRLRIDEIIPLKDPINGLEVPAYQIYLSVAWLRKEGLLLQHGREGYELPSGDLEKRAMERFEAMWSR